MRRVRGRRLTVVGLVGGVLAASTLAVAASAGQGDHPHFLPKRLNNVPELSTVVLNPATKTFVQLVFDRGRITSVQATAAAGASSNAGTITVLQRQQGIVWRTQSFTIPASAEVFAGGQKKSLAKLRVGMHVRIEQSGAPGGALEVVRVDAGNTAAAAALPIAGGTASG
jgi:hypothetical protein